MRSETERELERAQDDGERAFVLAFDAFTRAVRRARGAQTAASPEALTLSQYALLEALAGTETARVAQLAEEAGITPSTATRILDALERRGIVCRTRDPADRRAVAVTLSERGRRQLCAQQEWVGARKREFVAGLPAEQQAFVPALIRGLAGLIDELAAGPAE